MIRRLPLIPTIVVLIAVAVMIALGFWQLDRRGQKLAQIERYKQSVQMSADVPFPRDTADFESALYRRSAVDCIKVLSTRSTASRNLEQTSGLAQVANCRLAGGGETEVFLGWTQRFQSIDWPGGEVSGFVAPSGKGVRLIASPPGFGLLPLPPPDPREVPNNHFAYAVQWFFFAATALIIYALVLRKVWREEEEAD